MPTGKCPWLFGQRRSSATGTGSRPTLSVGFGSHIRWQPGLACRYASVHGARRVGGRNVVEAPFRCPRCGSVDTPKLVVRGTGLQGDGLFLRCRTCESEWADTRSDLRAS